MFYIQKTSCISSQHSFKDIDLDRLVESKDKRLMAIEPTYGQIPPGVLRRMGKAVRMGVGASMAILPDNAKLNGVIIGSANSGKEDCVKFLNQIKDYDEGMLTPLNFVQGTPNSVAAQIGLLTKNHGYNITHLHLGLAFEFAVIDADMKLSENPEHEYLLGAVDDVSLSYYYFEDKNAAYKKQEVSNKDLYSSDTAGSIAGEAAVMFMVNSREEGAVAKIIATDTLHSKELNLLNLRLREFLAKNLPAGTSVDLFMSGENGDERLKTFYESVENIVDENAGIARFKHMSGEFPTASAMGLWLCCEILNGRPLPAHMIKKYGSSKGIKTILLYNVYKGNQHGFTLLGR